MCDFFCLFSLFHTKISRKAIRFIINDIRARGCLPSPDRPRVKKFCGLSENAIPLQSTNLKEMKNTILTLLTLIVCSCAANNQYTIRGAFEEDFIKDSTIVRMLDIDGRVIDSTVVDSA